ncbi:hypothetical protein [Burkholderia ambifaria]|uniref:hypothetical protein n=1 Tax=Burkholderia ambifaria TaxID=152480 RepID=UPI00158AD97B|nr:hypothetical protein [Burkholderia ambifaria]
MKEEEEHPDCPYFLRSLIQPMVQQLHTPPPIAIEGVTIDQYAMQDQESAD